MNCYELWVFLWTLHIHALLKVGVRHLEEIMLAHACLATLQKLKSVLDYKNVCQNPLNYEFFCGFVSLLSVPNVFLNIFMSHSCLPPLATFDDCVYICE